MTAKERFPMEKDVLAIDFAPQSTLL